MFNTRRAALSLLELLIVIAMIGVLLSLLLSAVQKVREAAARMKCANQLKQQILAWHMHADTHGYYPTASRDSGFSDRLRSGPVRFESFGSPSAGGSGRRGQIAGWRYQLLPYLEQETFWRQADAGTLRTARTRLISTPVPVYLCPSRGRPATVYFDPQGPSVQVQDYPPSARKYPTQAVSDYAANLGKAAGPTPDGVVESSHSGTILVRHEAVTDGLSATLFLGEVYIPTAFHVGPNEYVNESYLRSDSCAGAWLLDFKPYQLPMPPLHDTTPPPSAKGLSALTRRNRFGSAHAAGMNAAFGDGSFRSISYSVSIPIWLAMCGRNDGIAPGGDF